MKISDIRENNKDYEWNIQLNQEMKQIQSMRLNITFPHLQKHWR